MATHTFQLRHASPKKDRVINTEVDHQTGASFDGLRVVERADRPNACPILVVVDQGRGW